jgi:hypothetical protein
VNEHVPVIGSRWMCQRCHVGETSMRKPDCWVCGSTEFQVPSHRYRSPASAAFLHPMLNPQETT